MILRNKNILLISPEPWDHIFVSKHHYAIHLARRGNRVYFLGPPGNSESLEATEYENVTVINYRGFPRGLRFYPPIVHRYFFAKAYRKLERLCLVRFDVVWSFDNSVFFDFSALPPQVLRISHIVDLSQNFQFAAAARTADICLGVSRTIVEKQKGWNLKSYFINHGYSIPKSEQNIFVLRKDFSCRIGYAGNLDLKYINWEILQQVITQHSEVGFYFVGPYTPNAPYITWLERQANAFLLGRYPSEQLEWFYSQVDALIICYRSDEYAEQLENSHKMIEYLASGKMIIGTFTKEYTDLCDQGLIAMSKDSDTFVTTIGEVLANLKYWNEETKQRLRRDWALNNTYDKQLDRIENLIN